MGRIASTNCPSPHLLHTVVGRLLAPALEITSLVLAVALGIVVALLPVADAGALPAHDRVRILTTMPEIADAELTDHNGHSFKLSSLQGRATLILFGFTRCPDVCPMGMEQLRQLIRVRTSSIPDQVAYVMISVDGERDAPDVMKQYVQGFCAGVHWPDGRTGEGQADCQKLFCSPFSKAARPAATAIIP